MILASQEDVEFLKACFLYLELNALNSFYFLNLMQIVRSLYSLLDATH